MDEGKKGITIAIVLLIFSAVGFCAMMRSGNFEDDFEKGTGTLTVGSKAEKGLEPNRKIIDENKKDLTNEINSKDVTSARENAETQKGNIQTINKEEPKSWEIGTKKDKQIIEEEDLVKKTEETIEDLEKEDDLEELLTVGSGDVVVTVPELEEEDDDIDLSKLVELFEFCGYDFPVEEPILFVDIEDKNTSSGWEWKEKWKVIDKNNDNNPEYVWYWALGIYKEDKNNDNNPEYKFVIERNFTLYNNDSDEKFNVAIGTQECYEFYDFNSDGKFEYESASRGDLIVKGQDIDNPEYMSIQLIGYQRLDNNTNGNYEFVRNISASIVAHNDTSGESANVELEIYQCYDEGDDTAIEYQGILVAEFKTVGVDIELSMYCYEVYDKDLDGNPEAQRGFWVGLMAHDDVVLHFEGFDAIDCNSNGEMEHIAVLIISYEKKGTNETGVVWGYEGIDIDEDGNPEMQNCTVIVAYTDSKSNAYVNATLITLLDSNSNGVYDGGGLLTFVYILEDIDGDGNPEKECAALVAYEFIDKNEDSNKEIERILVCAYEANDTNSNGHFEEEKVLIVWLELLDNNSDGVSETTCVIGIGYEKIDTNDDGNAEFEHAVIKGAEVIDSNQNGNPEVVRLLEADMKAYDNNTNGIQELELAYLVYYEVQDYDDNGTTNYEHILVILYKGEDTDEDGTIDVETIYIWERIIQKP